MHFGREILLIRAKRQFCLAYNLHFMSCYDYDGWILWNYWHQYYWFVSGRLETRSGLRRQRGLMHGWRQAGSDSTIMTRCQSDRCHHMRAATTLHKQILMSVMAAGGAITPDSASGPLDGRYPRHSGIHDAAPLRPAAFHRCSLAVPTRPQGHVRPLLNPIIACSIVPRILMSSQQCSDCLPHICALLLTISFCQRRSTVRDIGAPDALSVLACTLEILLLNYLSTYT